MNDIYNWVKNIIIFLVLSTIINNLLGKSTYKRYINLITGIILVILVISPLFKLFELDKSLDYFMSTNFFVTETENISEVLLDSEKEQRNRILKEYKERIHSQIASIIENQDLYIIDLNITIDEDSESVSFGSLKTVDLVAGYKKQKKKEDRSEIEPIEINKIDIGYEEEDGRLNERDYLSPEEINVKNLLSDFYNMKLDNINISIQES